MTPTTRLPPPRIDMTGATVQTWRVIGPSQPYLGRAMWQAVCGQCGARTELCGQEIRRQRRVQECQRCRA